MRLVKIRLLNILFDTLKMRRPSIFIITLALCLSYPLSMPCAGQNNGSDSLRGASSLAIPHLKLKGTLFTRSLKPLAIIEDTRNGRVVTYELGDTLGGGGAFEIVHIARGQVIFKTPAGEYMLSFPDGSVPQPRSFDAVDGKWYDIRKDGNTFTLNSATAANAISRVGEIMRNLRIKPCYVSGEKSGVVISRLTPIGILKESGVREGDIVKSINGLKLNTPHQVFSAYNKLKDQKELRVDIVRDSQPLALTYKIES